MGISFIPVWHGDSRKRHCILQAQLTTFNSCSRSGTPSADVYRALLGAAAVNLGSQTEIKAQWGLGSLLLFCTDVLRHMHRHRVVW